MAEGLTGGTGSNPDFAKGWQRESLLQVRKIPLPMPWVLIASMA